jgi:phytoene synthase
MRLDWKPLGESARHADDRPFQPGLPMPSRALGADAGFAADLEACRRAMRGGSKTFFAASLILPAAARGPATALYAFCRAADDMIDGASDPARALDAVRGRLRRIYEGGPFDDPADRSFARVVDHFAIPRALPEALIEGFEWDAVRRRYPDMSSLFGYGARVAGTVGAMMAIVMGARGSAAYARACELGVAMQLTNIARDVGEDARMGRVYLPLDRMRAAGLDADAFLAAPRFDGRVAAVVREVLDAAEGLYARGVQGIPALPAGCRPAIRAAADLYAEIGREVARRGFDSVSARAVVAPSRKAGVLSRAILLARRGADAGLAPLPEIAWLAETAAASRRALGHPPPPWWRLDARVERMILLLERLDERQQYGGGR